MNCACGHHHTRPEHDCKDTGSPIDLARPMTALQGRLICADTAQMMTALSLLSDHADLSRGEPGCLRFDLWQDEDPLICPACGICPLIDDCDARAQGIAAELPRKTAKAAKPTRTGIAWVALSGDALLLEERPPKGLLGGTLAFPSAGWDGRDLPPPGRATWSDIGEVRHVFTHFNLTLTVMLGDLDGPADRGRLVPLRQFDRNALPGLMRKVWDMARSEIAA